MSEEAIKKVLSNSGLTEKETEVYIFLAKHNVRKGTEIARLLRKDKAQVFVFYGGFKPRASWKQRLMFQLASQ